jgi:L-2-hydroxyglutarate oxidase LhgO
MADVDILVVGAGVIGLAIARRLAMAGRSVVVVESAEGIGTQTSSRNSEVIHAGIYYPTGSLKAQLCVAGRAALYDYCQVHHIPFRRCGKLIVAADEAELAALARLLTTAHANGAAELELIDARSAQAMEPALTTVGALWSPMTGILDSHAFMLALQGEAEDNGAAFAFHAPLHHAEPIAGGGFLVAVGGRDSMCLETEILVNAAGLAASRVARSIAGLDATHVPETRFARGHYFTLMGRAPFSRLVYPAPHTHGLGVHVTIDLAGQARFGPDVQWIDRLDYTVDPERARDFYAAIRRYWPALPDGALQPGYAGIRPKIAGPGDPAPDFRIDGPARHGLAGLVNLFGIESPGLTASLAIADQVASELDL